MRVRLLTALVLLSSAGVVAQSAPPPAPQAQAPATSPAPATPGTEAPAAAAAPTPPRPAEAAPPPAPRKAEVPDAEKLRQSKDAVQRMRAVLQNVLAKLEQARADKDVVRLNCVNEKLTQIKGLLRITEQADVALQEALARQESQAAEHEYLKVTIARQKVEQLNAESEECIGQLAFRTDERQEVIVEEPEGLPDDPTSPRRPSGVVSRPPPASPTL